MSQIIADFGCSGTNPSTVSGVNPSSSSLPVGVTVALPSDTVLAQKYFPAPTRTLPGISGTSAGSASPTPPFPGLTLPNYLNAQGQINIPSKGAVLNGRPFEIDLVGNFEVGSGGACPSVLIEVVANTGTISTPNYTVIANSNAMTLQNLTGVLYPFSFKIQASGDTGSGLLQGRYSFIGDAVVSKNNVALVNTLSGLNFGSNSGVNVAANAPVFGLLCRVTFSVSAAGNAANLFTFTVSA